MYAIFAQKGFVKKEPFTLFTLIGSIVYNMVLRKSYSPKSVPTMSVTAGKRCIPQNWQLQ